MPNLCYTIDREVLIVKKTQRVKTLRDIKLPDFSEQEAEVEALYECIKTELDSFWDGETILDKDAPE